MTSPDQSTSTRSIAPDMTPRHTTGVSFTPPFRPSVLTLGGTERPRTYSTSLRQSTEPGGPVPVPDFSAAGDYANEQLAQAAAGRDRVPSSGLPGFRSGSWLGTDEYTTRTTAHSKRRDAMVGMVAERSSRDPYAMNRAIIDDLRASRTGDI